MNTKKVRVRFAPSPTGGLHLGGVRTVLFNYLFAKQNGGDFIVRIEDTDQTRFVEGAEEYIFKCLEWCGLQPDESPLHSGPFAPYRQSERKAIYLQYAEQLIAAGQAYYAFDTAEELDEKRKAINNFQYSQHTRNEMKNSLVLDEAATQQLLNEGAAYVIRIKMPEETEVHLNDMIRGDVSFNTSLIDDKVLLKADGMPTYHLAVVVDDFLMQITHAFRGEEWLPSAPVHVLLWQYLFGIENMPQWAHLPLILKPDGNGKLSKRDGDRLGFPVFAMDWKDPKNEEVNTGFKEKGFLSEAFVNMLAMLGWNSGTEQEVFSLDELVQQFSIERVHKGGAKFDYEKAKWYNGEWIKMLDADILRMHVKNIFGTFLEKFDDAYIGQIIALVKERCILLSDFKEQAGFFFQSPKTIDTASLQSKWDEKKKIFFSDLITQFEVQEIWNTTDLEQIFKALSATHELKQGELMLPFRIMLVGGKFGPTVFEIAALIGKSETTNRIKHVLNLLS